MSFNSLLNDPDLIAHWNGDANGDGTGDADDVQGNYDGTWAGTEAYEDAPQGIDGKAFSVNGAGHIDLSSPVVVSGQCTFVAWLKNSDSATTEQGLFCNSANWIDQLRYNGSGKWRHDLPISTQSGGIHDGASPVFDGDWHSVAFVFGTAGTTSYIDGVQTGSTTKIWDAGFQSIDQLFRAYNRQWKGAGSDLRFYTRELSLSELQEIHGKTEPSNIAGTLDSAGNYSITADDPSNGTIIYETRLVDSTNTVLDTDAGATGTFTTTPDSQGVGTYYLEVRASNDGGYDVGDSPVGGSSDGWYRVASVVVVAAEVVSPNFKSVTRPITVKSVSRPITVHTVST